MIKSFFRKTLLSLTIIFLLLAVIFLFDYYFSEPKKELDAFFGLLIIASFFGIPYLVFFRKSSTDKNNKQTLIARRCKYCNSSELSPHKNGSKCEHCGAFYE